MEGMTPHETVIMMNPVGWWLNYKGTQWTGPFKTDTEAMKAAEYIVPLAYKEYHLLQVAPWDNKTISIKR